MEGKLQVDNPLNTTMHYGKDAHISGVVEAPAFLPVSQLYSGTQCAKVYNQMQKDLYVSQKGAAPKKKGTPQIIKIVGGAIASYVLFALAKPSLAKFFGKFTR